MRSKPIICAALVALTWFVFAPVVHYPFLNYDDPAYTFERAEVMHGLSWDGVAWAFTHVHSGNWHPLTSISHMLDCQIFGLRAGGHHFVNVLLHTVSVVVLFLTLLKVTSMWRAGFVAAVFAIHPLHVESVAWIAERKDVLSGMFFMFTLTAYVNYARSPSKSRYMTMSILYALGLMSKPMLVTLPLILLLSDWWPLGRLTNARRCFIEKIPLFVMTVGSCVATLIAQQQAISSFSHLPLRDRLMNALMTSVIYIRQTFWPVDLAIIYPLRQNAFAWWQVAAAAIVLFCVTTFAWRLRRTRPYFFTGWLWYLVMLLPVIGIIQVGIQAHADRYMYLPQIGLVLIAVGFVGDIRWQPALRPFIAATSAVVLTALVFLSRKQLAYWRDPIALWEHTIAVTSDNDIAHAHLADLLLRIGKVGDAVSHAQESLRINEGNADGQNNLGLALLQAGDEQDAALHLEEGLKFDPNNLNARVNLAWILATSANATLRNGPRAVDLVESVARGPGRENAIVLRTLAAAYAEAGRFSDAIDVAMHALALARSGANEGLVSDLERSLAAYRNGEPIRSKVAR